MSTSKSNITPLHDRVLIKPAHVDDTQTPSGIIIPDTVSKERPETGKVVAVGKGRITDDGKVLPMNVKVGDTVLFSKYGPDEVTVNDEDYVIINEGAILAILK